MLGLPYHMGESPEDWPGFGGLEMIIGVVDGGIANPHPSMDDAVDSKASSRRSDGRAPVTRTSNATGGSSGPRIALASDHLWTTPTGTAPT